jgi:S-DNA-T family DNA segregation ATPase FtsK/SpoIIIE
MPVEVIDRPPRIQPELPADQIKIPQAPKESDNQASRLLTTVLPLVGTLGFLLSSRSGNLLMIVIMGVVMGGSFIGAIFAQRQAKKQFEKKKQAYLVLLSSMRQN